MSIKSEAKTKKSWGRRVKSWPNVASKQLQSRKKVQQKYRDIACKANFFPLYLRQAAKIYIATSHSVVWQETLNPLIMRQLYITCIQPSLEYASIAWGGLTRRDEEKLEKCNRSAARLIANISPSADIPREIVLARAGCQRWLRAAKRPKSGSLKQLLEVDYLITF